AQIFVSKTFGDLEIFFHSGHHEQLLVLLGRLGQSVKFPRGQSAWDEKIACPFWSAFGKNGRFNFDEALRVEVVTSRLSGLVTDAEVPREVRPAQIKIAIG